LFTIPAWRAAAILADRDGVAALLQAEARAWTWDGCAGVDRWVASELSGYAEEIVRLRGATARGNATLAAVMTAILALRMARIVAVYRRLLLDTENTLWDAVAEHEGGAWAGSQMTAFGVSGGTWQERASAAVRLFALTADAVGDVLDERERSVVRHALGD
jgi:hypothetical protein